MSKRVKCFARLANLKISALSMGKSPFISPDSLALRSQSSGFSKASGLFELWLYGICGSRIRIARIKERNCAI